MSDSPVINQRAPMSSSVTQIGVQNNGISPQDACQLALDLFMQNFPKLQELAAETARERSEEFCRETINKLQSYRLFIKHLPKIYGLSQQTACVIRKMR